MKNDIPNIDDRMKKILLDSAQRAIDNYQGFDMVFWSETPEQVVGYYRSNDKVIPEPKPECGTVGCYAFEICVTGGDTPASVLDRAREYAINSNSMFRSESVLQRALTILDPEDRTAIKISQICYIDNWPTYLFVKYHSAEPFSVERALVLKEAVNHWIANDGDWDEEEEGDDWS